jgi:ADP-heptose:LPS heptosyltransferase
MEGLKSLIVASSGVGDILRITPLVRVLYQLGYLVDVLIEPDYPEIATLLDDAPEIHNLFVKSSKWSSKTVNNIDGLDRRSYDLAIFSALGAPLQQLVKAKRILTFDQYQWRKDGDSHCIHTIAQKLGWYKVMPRPFALASKKKFSISSETIAIHPGCKPNWPWKKWHGFDELARILPKVVIIGTQSDLNNAGTYFQKEFNWPQQAENYVDRLDLKDTASLISQCNALISNDSGIMNLGAALGVLTFGIFGITNPDREMMPLDNMIAITNEKVCAKECRKLPWGSKNCRLNIACLKLLTADDVAKLIFSKI